MIAIASFLLISGSYKALSTNIVSEKFDIFKLFQSGKFLIIFQNNSELRATGGFIGSYAIVDTQFGKIKNIAIEKNIYKKDDKYQYMLKKPAPEPLVQFLGEKFWSLHDANWYVDFPQSAKQIEWFYENEGGEKIDGVFAINATFVADLLNLIGPINVDGEELNASNFVTKLQYDVEKKYYQDDKNIQIDEPKTIIADAAKVILEKLNDKKNQAATISYAFKKIAEKEIQLYFNNQDLENIVLDKNWGGAIIKQDVDYLYVNNSNLGGMKSSLNVKQNIDFNAEIDDNGNIVDNLAISRIHSGTGEWPDYDNINYTRILVPKGSHLNKLTINGQDYTSTVLIGEEAGKTVFGLWINTPVRQSNIVELSYELPFIVKDKNYYNLIVQKQPGAKFEDAQIIVNNNLRYQGELLEDLKINFK